MNCLARKSWNTTEPLKDETITTCSIALYNWLSVMIHKLPEARCNLLHSLCRHWSVSPKNWSTYDLINNRVEWGVICPSYFNRQCAVGYKVGIHLDYPLVYNPPRFLWMHGHVKWRTIISAIISTSALLFPNNALQRQSLTNRNKLVGNSSYGPWLFIGVLSSHLRQPSWLVKVSDQRGKPDLIGIYIPQWTKKPSESGPSFQFSI